MTHFLKKWMIHLHTLICQIADLSSQWIDITIKADVIRIFDSLSLYVNHNFDSDGINPKDIVLMQIFFTKT